MIELVAPHTVNTMLEVTLKAVGAWEGPISDKVSGDFAEARNTVRSLRAVGIELENIGEQLESEGIATFVQSWTNLIAAVEEQIMRARAEAADADAIMLNQTDVGSCPVPSAAFPGSATKRV